jgi:hypothetical protein
MHFPDANPLPTFLPRPLANRSLPRQQHNVQPAKKALDIKPIAALHRFAILCLWMSHRASSFVLGVGYFLRVHLGAIAVCARTST